LNISQNHHVLSDDLSIYMFIDSCTDALLLVKSTLNIKQNISRNIYFYQL